MIHPLTPPEVTPQVIAVNKLSRSLGITLGKTEDGKVKICFHDSSGWDYIILPLGEWETLGLYSQATEEMAMKMFPVKYNDEGKPSLFGYDDFNGGIHKKAKDALNACMNSHKLYLVNPYGEKPQEIKFDRQYENEWDIYEDKLNKWQEAEKNKSDYVFLINPTPAINI